MFLIVVKFLKTASGCLLNFCMNKAYIKILIHVYTGMLSLFFCILHHNSKYTENENEMTKSGSGASAMILVSFSLLLMLFINNCGSAVKEAGGYEADLLEQARIFFRPMPADAFAGRSAGITGTH
jgi:hypothetical protein